MRREELSLPQNPKRDRPNDRWTCGRVCDQKCGKDAKRELPQCAHGPSRDGRCPVFPACKPRRSWAGWRRRIAVVCLATFCMVLIVANQHWLLPSVMKPGELTQPHAQILSGTLTSQRCAACHEPDALSISAWFSSAAGSGHENVLQTDRCMDCHHSTMDRDLATMAHNLPSVERQNRSERIRLTSLESGNPVNDSRWTKTSLDQDNIQCATCHKEHRGAEADMMALSDAQCQTCHSRDFGGFAASHPDWKSWPYGRGGEIAFNHATHAGKHFPATLVDGTATVFACGKCHPSQNDSNTATLANARSLGGELLRTASYEQACASCHDQSLDIQVASGIELASLPIVPQRVSKKVAGWPENATGFYDGRLSPLAQLLLRGDESAARAIRNVPDGDFSKLRPDSSVSDSAALTIATQLQAMMLSFASEGQADWTQRVRSGGAAPASTLPILRSLPPQFIQAIYDKWFLDDPQPLSTDAASLAPHERFPSRTILRVNWQPDDLLLDDSPSSDSLGGDALLADDVLAGDVLADDVLADDVLVGGDGLLNEDGLLGEPLGDALIEDALLEDPLAADSTLSDKTPQVRQPHDLVSAGGWYHDDLRMAIVYRGSGHADPVLVAWIDTLAQLAKTDPIRVQAAEHPSVAACIACHPNSLSMPGQWRAASLVGRKSEFTKFSHRPHLNVSQLGDCQHCHVINTQPQALVDFHPLTKQACTACHLPTAAGDHCVTCHRYHIDMR
ncbi:hypothetical protein [Stieleria varia]|uniref:Cytochrome c domain-containing protein n=1 Tax=Stieleria varia TaxID=2528005 RepID=A0A5C6BAY1_9BACT|nr:hypothetical protein [Stieleria varia]TWU07674.1 hypothetical protein Pla52n_02470 [Stieleria varia]